MQKTIVILIIALLAYGCAAQKQANKPESEGGFGTTGEVLKKTLENNLTNRDFYISKGKISTSGETGRITLFFTMKYKMPGKYLISLRTRTGIEAFRVFLTPDTVLINDRLNQNLLFGRPADFERITGLPADLLKISVGDYFANKPVLDLREKCTDNITRASDYFLGLIVRSTIDCEKKKTSSVQISSGTTDEYINLNYKKHRDDINKVPKKVEINDFRRRIKIIVSIEKYAAPWYGEIDFIPGSGYKIRPLI